MLSNILTPGLPEVTHAREHPPTQPPPPHTYTPYVHAYTDARTQTLTYAPYVATSEATDKTTDGAAE